MATSALTSGTAGYLAPSTAVEYDDSLEDVLHEAIAGITGLPGDLVRPRWQPEPPQQPAFSADWVAFGVMRNPADIFAYEYHDPSGGAAGVNVVERDELLHVLHSFYGPNASGFCTRFRDGMQIAQNRDELASHGIAVVEIQEPVRLPALLKEKWVNRVDATVIYRRRTSRTYPVQTIESGDVGLNNEHYVTPIIINHP